MKTPRPCAGAFWFPEYLIIQPTAKPLGMVARSPGLLRVGREGGLRRGRREYVPVGSVAASMRLTPLRNPPSRPRTVSLRVHPGLKKEEQEQQPCCFRGRIRFPQENGSDPSFHLETQRSCHQTPKCREGWVGAGWRDRWRHGWRHRAPMDGFTACLAWPPRPSRPLTIQSRPNAVAVAVAVASKPAAGSAAAAAASKPEYVRTPRLNPPPPRPITVMSPLLPTSTGASTHHDPGTAR